MRSRAEVLICGAGIAGVSAAYHLVVGQGIKDVLLVDERPPLSLTSDQSTECYRNWWPGPGDAMVRLMNRSIDIMESLADESGNAFSLNRRGYLYCTSRPQAIPEMKAEALAISRLGAGPLRVHRGEPSEPAYQPAPAEGYRNQPDGADLLLDPVLIHQHFPYISGNILAALHARRAGWFSAQQMGMYLLEQARKHGLRLVKDRITGVEVVNGRVSAAHLATNGRVLVNHFVNAAGPFLKSVGAMLGLDLPVYNELHLKAAFNDQLGVLSRAAPLTIYRDSQSLHWTPEERKLLAEDESLSWLLEELPAGSHIRPEGGPDSQMVLVLWEYRTRVMEPTWPLPLDPQYAEIALRGLARLIPGMSAYLERLPRPHLDGGYYTRTAENRPLIGELPVKGAYVIGALSGFGLMAACGAGDLLAAQISGAGLPAYAPAFALGRYQDPAYQQLLADWGESGQL
jgi:glycine/D-amino acid oxidase-like deaminating enzyme